MREKKQDIDFSRGCCFYKNDQDEAEVLSFDGGQKLGTYDWLSNLPEAGIENDVFEVRFKNTRKGYYKNTNKLTLKKGDVVAVEASPGHDIGIVSLTGELVARQMRKTGVHPNNLEFKKIYRKAKPADIEKWQESIAREYPTMIQSRQIAAKLNLNMKLGDVEFQGDNTKAIFYYIADERVDFRQLIKDLAEAFKIRIEMRQIGARQEAGRIGGIGSCGRELCCSTWITSFSSVTTNSARHQEISLNPQKLAGQCGKLKCCLNYELDSYLDAQKDFPKITEPLQLLDGLAYLQKTDIFKRLMWFSSAPDSAVNLVAVSVDRVKEIMSLNRKGQKADKLLGELEEDTLKKSGLIEEPDFKNVVGEDSITRFDKSGKKSSRNRRGRGDRDRGAAPASSASSQAPSNSSQNAQGNSARPSDAEGRRPMLGNGRTNANGNQQRPMRADKRGDAQQAPQSSAERPQQDNRQNRSQRGDSRRRPQREGRRPDRGDRQRRGEDGQNTPSNNTEE